MSSEPTQVVQIRRWVAGELHVDHESFAMSKGFAKVVIDHIDSLESKSNEMDGDICTCSYCPTHHEGFMQVPVDDLRAVLSWVEYDAWDDNADLLGRLARAAGTASPICVHLTCTNVMCPVHGGTGEE